MSKYDEGHFCDYIRLNGKGEEIFADVRRSTISLLWENKRKINLSGVGLSGEPFERKSVETGSKWEAFLLALKKQAAM